MDYWQRVDLEAATESQSATGAVVVDAWTATAEDVEARILPVTSEEMLESWATPEEEAYEIQLRGEWTGISLKHRVTSGSDAYDIRRVLTPPPFGEPATILHAVKVTP